MSIKILVVDDEPSIVELLKYNLENSGYEIKEAYDGVEALNMVSEERFDLIILDLMLPKIDGIEVCKRLKREDSHIPIIMLTAKSSEADKVLGLNIGADDYITKPFSIKELIARVNALLRRIGETEKQNGGVIINLGNLRVDLERHEVEKNGELLDLTLKEFELLRILLENKGKVLSRNILLDKVWGYDFYGETRTVDVHVRNLRKKIEDDDRNPQYIETVRGVGYRIGLR
ncbi:response regulator transcription factor [Clostridium sp. Cult3]|uniref:response regulator transcription factor n=1 Tax=Clostridium sp. Cult3 TaxID=2079004 RepID=UPI001F481A40|nr:response regulator transcription factor [Clostridium sp. Cult3]MCF6460018.1 DNA-binding response regulator [Clostridium sp. Cult3]